MFLVLVVKHLCTVCQLAVTLTDGRRRLGHRRRCRLVVITIGAVRQVVHVRRRLIQPRHTSHMHIRTCMHVSVLRSTILRNITTYYLLHTIWGIKAMLQSVCPMPTVQHSPTAACKVLVCLPQVEVNTF